MEWDALYRCSGHHDADVAFSATNAAVEAATLRSTVTCPIGGTVSARLRFIEGDRLFVGVIPLAARDDALPLYAVSTPGLGDAPGAMLRCDGTVWVAGCGFAPVSPPPPPAMFAPGQVLRLVVDRRHAPGTIAACLDVPFATPVPFATLPSTGDAARVSLCVAVAQFGGRSKVALVPPTETPHASPLAPTALKVGASAAPVYFGPRAKDAFTRLEALAARVGTP